MNVIQSVAMLAPLAVIAAINVSLYLYGERGTLLVPSAAELPAVTLLPAACQAVREAPAVPEFEEELRLAA